MKVRGECVNYSSVNCNMPSAQGSNNKKISICGSQSDSGSQGFYREYFGTLGGARGGLVDGTLGPLVLLNERHSTVIFSSIILLCIIGRENYIVYFRISELCAFKYLLTQAL